MSIIKDELPRCIDEILAAYDITGGLTDWTMIHNGHINRTYEIEYTNKDGKKAKNCENGVSYQGYLKGFLYTVSSERLAYRMMDVMERTVRLHPMYADCRMDHVLCGISYRMDYEWQPLFSGLMVHTGRDLSGLCYQTQRTFSYD